MWGTSPHGAPQPGSLPGMGRSHPALTGASCPGSLLLPRDWGAAGEGRDGIWADTAPGGSTLDTPPCSSSLRAQREAQTQRQRTERGKQTLSTSHGIIATPSSSPDQTEPQELQQELGFEAHPSLHLPRQNPGFSILQH